MANPFRFTSPDRRLQFLKYARGVEERRAQRLLATTFPAPGDPSFETGRRLPGSPLEARLTNLSQRVGLPAFARALNPFFAAQGQADLLRNRVPGDPSFERGAFLPEPSLPPERQQDTGFTLGPYAGDSLSAPPRNAPFVQPPTGAGPVLGRLEALQTQFVDPMAAAATQVASSPIGQVLPGMESLRVSGQAAQEAGVKEFVPGVAPTSFAEIKAQGLVNPGKAAWGSEEEQQKAQGVLEETGIATAMAFRIALDPLNFLPIVGFTKADDFMRLIRLAGKAKGPKRATLLADITGVYEAEIAAARTAPRPAIGADVPAARTAAADIAGTAAADVTTPGLIPSTVLQPRTGAVTAARVPRVAEFDTPRLPGEELGDVSQAGKLPPDVETVIQGGGGPRTTLFEKLTVAGREAPTTFAETKRLVSDEFGRRAARAVELRDELLAQGVEPMEANLRATTELKDPMPFKAVTGIDLTTAEELYLFDQLRATAQFGEQAKVSWYLQKMQRSIVAGEKVKDFPPFVWGILERSLGRDFTAQMKVAVKQRVKVVNEVVEETAAAKMAIAPRGVTTGGPIPPSRGGTQPGLPRGAPGAPPEGVSRSFWEQEQFRAMLRMSETTPRPPIGERAAVGGGVRGTFREAEAFPAPGATLKEVTPERGAPLIDFIADSLGILKPIMSSMDLSWFRQTAKTIARHPFITKESLAKGTKAALSEDSAVEWMKVLKAEGVADEGFRVTMQTPEGVREIGLGRLLEDRFMAVPGTPGFGQSDILARPEWYSSRVAAMIPGVRQSGRAFAIGWNTQFSGISRYWLSKFMKMNRGVLDQKQVEAALNLAERLLGKGELGTSWFAKAFKALGFAPGYRASGPQAYLTLISPKTPANIRRMAAEELLTWAATGNAMLTALKYGTGATVVTTLGANQFGRIKFPGSDTYYNIWGTDNVLARAVLMAATQRRIDVKGNITQLGDGEKTPAGFLKAMRDVGWQYVKSGEDPVVGFMQELATGETYIGEKLDWDFESAWKVAKNRLPMILQDFMDLAETEGPLQTALGTATGIFGAAGVTSYTPTRETFRAMPKWRTDDEAVVEDVLNREVPGPLSLTANEERTLGRFLREDVQGWVEDMEDKHGSMPSEISMEQVIQMVGKEKGLDSRSIAGALFLHKAKGSPEKTVRRDYIRFALENRGALEDFYDTLYQTDYMQDAQQWAEQRGLVPVR